MTNEGKSQPTFYKGSKAMKSKMVTLFLVTSCFVFCVMVLSNLTTLGGEAMELKIKSSAFNEGGMIPKKYTCDGANVSPPLAWDAVPTNTKSLALISDDPDAPVGTWVHWVIYNIPPTIKELPENIPPHNTIENGAQQGTNDFRMIGYGGPCPPRGTHRYYFKLYALDKVLDGEPGLTKAHLLKAMEGHIVAQGQLMGRYQR
jgi:Raf kinase inhibitor-like YbhB/YbcL family protein